MSRGGNARAERSGAGRAGAERSGRVRGEGARSRGGASAGRAGPGCAAAGRAADSTAHPAHPPRPSALGTPLHPRLQLITRNPPRVPFPPRPPPRGCRAGRGDGENRKEKPADRGKDGNCSTANFTGRMDFMLRGKHKTIY